MTASDDLVKRMTARRLDIQKGKFVNGVSPNVDPDTPPTWYDPDVFRHAQKLFATYKVIIRISQLYGLNLVLYHTEGLIPLLVTGNSKTISKLFTRYLSTMIHVTSWFEHDPFDPKSKTYRSLRMVRGMHHNVARRMNHGEKREEDGDTFLWINQYGMCHAQFSFIGMMAVFPKELGFHNFSPKDFHAMFHFWRVIGYCLGVDDRFNLCSGTDEETFELCRRIYFDDWMPVIREGREKTGIAMSQGICVAMQRVNPNLDYTALMYYAAPFLGLDRNQFPLQTFHQRMLYYSYLIMFKVATRFRFNNWILAKIADVRMKRAICNKLSHEEDLKQLYPDVTYDNDRCPFDVNFNYVDALQLDKKETV